MSTQRLRCAAGQFCLARYPARRAEPLKPWNSADELILAHLNNRQSPLDRLLVANDEHGALAVPLPATALWSDSELSVLSVQANRERNGLARIDVIPGDKRPELPFATVAMRVPKQLAFFEYQLALIGACLPEGAHLVAGGMDKHLSPRVADLIERYIGPTERHPGQRKARLFSAERDARPALTEPPPARYYCDELSANLLALPNVFSAGQLDIGARFLIEQLPRLKPATTVLDLACGNGVLGLAAKRQHLAGELVFCDESHMAMASTRHNAANVFAQEAPQWHYHCGDGLLAYRGPQADLILCNPPFHLHHTVDDFAGRRLLSQCADHLPAGGRLCLVANRHLNYADTLKRHLAHVEPLASNNKFVIWLAHKAPTSR